MSDEEEGPRYIVDYLDAEEPETASWIKREGKVRITYPNGDIFEGFVDQQKLKQGKGTYIWLGSSPDDEESKVEISRYEGNFVDGRREGVGLMRFKNGDVYEGEFLNNLMHGEGSYTYAKSNDIYSGSFYAGKKHGRGRYEYFKDSSILNQWEDGTVTTVKWHMKNAGSYEGELKRGTPVGPGGYTLESGIVQRGEFIEELGEQAPPAEPTDNAESETVPAEVLGPVKSTWSSIPLLRV